MDRPADRRQLLGAVGVTAFAAVATGDSAVMTPADRSRDTLAEVEGRLRSLAQGWETTPPTVLVEKLGALERRARFMNRWRMVPDLRRDWQHFRARVLVMSATALGDTGVPVLAATAARHAGALAAQVGDTLTVAHAGVVRAELEAYAFGHPERGLALAAAARAAAPDGYTAVLAMTAEANIRASRREPADGILGVLRHAEAVQATLPAGAAGYSLDGVHPGYLPVFGGAALIGAGEATRGRAWLEAAAELFDPIHASGAMSAIRLYQACAALWVRDLDEAQALATQALAVSAARPARWLSDGVVSLADSAGNAGEDWSELAEQAREWSPS
jgi:hypothetical protein